MRLPAVIVLAAVSLAFTQSGLSKDERAIAAFVDANQAEAVALLKGFPDATFDVVFGNAVFQWVPDHLAVLARLFAACPPGGALAMQVPDNLNQPTHMLMAAVAKNAIQARRSARVAMRPAIASAGNTRPYSRADAPTAAKTPTNAAQWPVRVSLHS